MRRVAFADVAAGFERENDADVARLGGSKNGVEHGGNLRVDAAGFGAFERH